MSNITVSDADISRADTFLTTYLSDKIPEADFTEGSVTRDFVVKAIAYIFAYLTKEQKTVRDSQSLLSLAGQAETTDVSESVDVLLSNWFITRKTGRPARVVATLHFSRSSDVLLQPGTRFFKSQGQIFKPDITAAYVIPAGELKPVVSAAGVITDYTTNVTLVAADTGATGNVNIGRFINADAFSPYFTYAENLTVGYDGKDVETTGELLTRAADAVTVRNLVNVKSIKTVLLDKFDIIKNMVTLGFGEPEMIRDRSADGVSRLTMHTGGFTDIYVDLSRTEVMETGVVGGFYNRPDGVVSVLRDEGVDFTTNSGNPVRVGDVLRVVAGTPDAPKEYLITAVDPHALQIQTRNAFPVATEDTAEYVKYTVGRLAPGFDNVVPARTSGVTSRTLQRENAVILRGRPRYKITKVETEDNGTPILFNTRVNGTPSYGEFQIIGRAPENGQSARAFEELVLPSGYAGKTIKVTYETPVGYEEIQAYVSDPYNRVLCADTLVKAYHPTYLSVGLKVRPRLGVGILDTAAIEKGLVDYVNQFDSNAVIDVSGITQFVRDNYVNVGVILDPIDVRYSLIAPDGQLFNYSTRDLVTIMPDHTKNSARLLNGAQLRSAILNADIDPFFSEDNAQLVSEANRKLRDTFKALGISDRTVRYLMKIEDVSVELAL